MKVQEQDIRDITGAVWTSVLQSDATAPWEVVEPPVSQPLFTGCVQMSGAWYGAVTLESSANLARAAAATMYDADPAKVSPGDIRDAWGELVNMVGGNIKALLPGPTELSLPFVVEGQPGALTIRNAVAVQRVCFQSFGETFVVTVFEASEGHSPVNLKK